MINGKRRMVMLDINEIKKDLYKSKNMAKFSHYQSGDLFYEIEFLEGKYRFPIAVVEEVEITDPSDFREDEEGNTVLLIIEDLGITPFGAEVKGSELIRWIQKAMKNEQLIKVG
jgi:hypothetical protein